jgi:hypothetical protein
MKLLTTDHHRPDFAVQKLVKNKMFSGQPVSVVSEVMTT